MKIFLFLFIFPIVIYAQKGTTARPDISKISIDDIKWMKAEESSFWFYYKPTHYLFKNSDFETISLENGNVLAYIYGLDAYVLLQDYNTTKPNTEQPVTLASTGNSILIRTVRGKGFWIFDKGINADPLKQLYINTKERVYFSEKTNRKYWVKEEDFKYGLLSTAISVVSE